MGTNIPRPTRRPQTPAVNNPVPEFRRTNCPNCCAVITGPICEYCGTRFSGFDPGDPKDNEVIIPIYIGNNKLMKSFEEVVNHNSDPAIVPDRQERQHS